LLYGLFDRARADGKNWYIWLAAWAAINIVVSFFYYLRFIRVMYLGDRVADAEPLTMSPALRTALVATLVGILFIGVYPQPLIVLAQKLFPAAQVTAPAASIAEPLTPK
jgi:NADH-quinone oxidoreductase subunit N